MQVCGFTLQVVSILEPRMGDQESHGSPRAYHAVPDIVDEVCEPVVVGLTPLECADVEQNQLGPAAEVDRSLLSAIHIEQAVLLVHDEVLRPNNAVENAGVRLVLPGHTNIEHAHVATRILDGRVARRQDTDSTPNV